MLSQSGFDGFLSVLVTLACVDWVLGLLDSQINDGASKRVFINVLSRKISEFCLVGVCHIIDKHILGDTSAVRTGVTLFYIAIEGESIIGHVKRLGLPIPKFLKDRFDELDAKMEKEKDEAIDTLNSKFKDVLPFDTVTESPFKKEIGTAEKPTEEPLKGQGKTVKSNPKKEGQDKLAEYMSSVYADLYDIDG